MIFTSIIMRHLNSILKANRLRALPGFNQILVFFLFFLIFFSIKIHCIVQFSRFLLLSHTEYHEFVCWWFSRSTENTLCWFNWGWIRKQIRLLGKITDFWVELWTSFFEVLGWEIGVLYHSLKQPTIYWSYFTILAHVSLWCHWLLPLIHKLHKYLWSSFNILIQVQRLK